MSLHPVRPEVLQLTPYVPGRSITAIQTAYGLTDVIKLASNESPLGPSPLAIQATQAAAAQSHLYPDPTAPRLRQALAAHTGLPADWVLVANGSDEILRLLAASYLSPGDRVVLPACSFPNYRAVSLLFGARVTAVDLAGEAPDLPAMAAAAPGARLLFLCRPNNPTGGVFAAPAFEALMAAVPPETLVLLDQAYHEFDPMPLDGPALLHRHPNLILTRTFSKAYGLAGLRVGYGLARPAIWAPLLRVREPFSVNRIAQEAALAALADQAHLDRTLAVVAEGRAFLTAACRRLGLRCAESAANFVLVDLERPADPVCEGLLRHGVIVRPCAPFGRPNCLRVSVGTAEANARFADALAKVLMAPA